MRHYKKNGMKLGTDASHTKAMKKSLVCALFEHDRIKTTQTRAKAIRPDVDRVITWAKRGDLAARRMAIKQLGDKELVREIFEKAAQGMWADRNGGYTRIMKLGTRKGDSAEIVIIELVTEPVTPKTRTAAPAPAPKPAAKVEEVIEVVEDEAEDALEEAEAEEAEAATEITESVEAAEDKAAEVVEEAKEAVETVAEEAKEAVESAVEAIEEKLEEAAEETKEEAAENIAAETEIVEAEEKAEE